MPEVVTVAERKAREVERRRKAAAEVIADLKCYAAEYGGRFLIFGSVVKGCIGPDSDFDVIVDFEGATETPAIEHVEEVCSKYRIPADIYARSTATSVFFDRVRRKALVIA